MDFVKPPNTHLPYLCFNLNRHKSSLSLNGTVLVFATTIWPRVTDKNTFERIYMTGTDPEVKARP